MRRDTKEEGDGVLAERDELRQKVASLSYDLSEAIQRAQTSQVPSPHHLVVLYRLISYKKLSYRIVLHTICIYILYYLKYIVLYYIVSCRVGSHPMSNLTCCDYSTNLFTSKPSLPLTSPPPSPPLSG